ncbi:hypothetical protein Vadar_021155 [Vaccinium darrowii]|nr:hypothetical protein Vadar_021155 [Vaccinium darrowii]
MVVVMDENGLRERIEFLVGIGINRKHIDRNLKCQVPINEKIYSEGAFRAKIEVKRWINCLCRYGLMHRDAFKVLRKEPRAITYEEKEISASGHDYTHEGLYNSSFKEVQYDMYDDDSDWNEDDDEDGGSGYGQVIADVGPSSV